MTGDVFSKKEAEFLWSRIGDHKWYVSEKLGRDVGLNVAAVDYLENVFHAEAAAAAAARNPRKFNESNLRPYGTQSSLA